MAGCALVIWLLLNYLSWITISIESCQDEVFLIAWTLHCTLATLSYHPLVNNRAYKHYCFCCWCCCCCYYYVTNRTRKMPSSLASVQYSIRLFTSTIRSGKEDVIFVLLLCCFRVVYRIFCCKIAQKIMENASKQFKMWLFTSTIRSGKLALLESLSMLRVGFPTGFP